MTDITVIGLGYIGLPTAALFASGGLSVRGVDVDERAVASVNAGASHIVEPGLEDMVASAVQSGALVATTQVGPSDAFIIAVPTPFEDNHQPDLSFVRAATESIAPHVRNGDLVILESTSPVGTTNLVASWLAELRRDLTIAGDSQEFPTSAEVSVAYCPERVLPGNILFELVNNDRIIGGLTPWCAERASSLYGKVVTGQCRLTTARTAELAKLTENAFRDVNIAFANELSLVAHGVDVNVWELIELANLHPRVNILQPGPGVGGHCIAVDPWFIVHADERTPLIQAARHVNDSKPGWVVDQVVEAAAAAAEPVVACLGLAYKPNIDDLRESPAVEVVRQLAGRSNMRVLAVEPNVDELPQQLDGYSVEFATLEHAIAQANIVVGLVPHTEFRAMNPNLFRGAAIIDPAGIFPATRTSDGYPSLSTGPST